jgi:nitroreductase
MPFNFHKLSTVIFHRRSSKAYLEHKLVPQEDLFSIFEAARWAPSSRNKQPWRYILFTENSIDEINLLRSCLDDSNQVWANKAPVLILACTEISDESGAVNAYAMHDAGLANENILLQIRSLGYICRPMGGFDKKKAKQLFNIPDNIQPIITIAVGFPGKLTSLSEAIQEFEKLPRSRNPISTWVHQNSWGNPFSDSTD